MKRDKLIERLAELSKKKNQCDIDNSKIMRDEGFLPFVMRANKKKITDEIEYIELELNKPEPVKKVATKKMTPKKEVKNDEEKSTEN